MRRWGILSVAAVVGLLVVNTGADDAGNSAAAVVSMEGTNARTVDITLPGDATRQEAEAVWERFEEISDWRFGDARASRGDSVTIQAQVVGSGRIDLNGMTPAWPFIVALSDYSKIAIVFLTGQGSPISGRGDFNNRYISAQWTQSQGVRHYQVTVRDASFENIEQLSSSQSSANPEAAPGGPSAIAWVILGLLAVAIGVGTYCGIRALMKSRK